MQNNNPISQNTPFEKALAPDILFFDLEVEPTTNRIVEFGAIRGGDQYRGEEKAVFEKIARGVKVICGHNILFHDLPVLKAHGLSPAFLETPLIDTLLLSVLLFPKKPYHPLVKDYQLNGSEVNNPLADAQLTQGLLWDLLGAYHQLPITLKTIYYHLLKTERGVAGFFEFVPPHELKHRIKAEDITQLIRAEFGQLICRDAQVLHFVAEQPLALAFALAFIQVNDSISLLPYWVKHQYPETIVLIDALRVTCVGNKGCPYCAHLSPVGGLQRFFGFEGFRRFPGDGEQALQEQVVEAALANKSLLAIFPTGGGKSLTFQLPALMKGAANRSLTVIISPLQSLMKDQVDVLKHRHGITMAETINGMLSPLERMEAIKRIEEGGANLLYISPESLRSPTIVRLLKQRDINRFVIDEAHCFSSWGQDFRVDYLYIGKFLKKLQAIKKLDRPIPVSCFTATAKPSVVEDICAYFEQHLQLHLEIFQTSSKRENLHYGVIQASKEDKYEKLKALLDAEEGPRIVYVARVKTSNELAIRLQKDGYPAKAYNGKMDREERIKVQEDFMSNTSNVDIIVATSAFGMGVDKDNVKMVVHYTISNSLENYLQESGRAGRSPSIEARCYVLFTEEDLEAHFTLLNHSKLSHKEIYQIWKSIKQFKRQKFSKSAMEIAREAGWSTEMRDLETRVKVAISALEESGYVKREENAPRVFAQSILVRNVEEAQALIQQQHFQFTGDQQMENAKRVFSSLISRARSNMDSRVDIMADQLGLDRSQVTSIINVFKSLGLLSNDKDLTAYYFTVQGKRNSINVFKRISQIEKRLFELIFPNENVKYANIVLRELNDAIHQLGVDCDLVVIKALLNYWARISYIKKERIDRTTEYYRILRNWKYDKIKNNLERRLEIAEVALLVVKELYLPTAVEEADYRDKRLIEFSVVNLKEHTEKRIAANEPTRFYEFVLLYFHHLKVLELKDGLMILYNPMNITRMVTDNTKRYTLDDYRKLKQYYQTKTEQIHVVGEYAKKRVPEQGPWAQYHISR
ncbi:MAG: RecQ family ATP-dependent DNA helicase [Bacteroidota bacterium]